MNKKINVIMMVLIIVVSSFCITTFSINNNKKCEAAVATTYSDDILYSETATQNVEIETIYYSWKDTTTYQINSTFPNYYNTNMSLTNTCANVAGANIVGFYDRYYDNLIPDYTTGIQRGNNYTYYPMSLNKDKKQAVINTLYASMKTNTKNDGTTQEDFENGLKAYVQSQGRNISYISVISGGNFNFANFDAELRNGRPVAFFLSGYNFVSFQDSGSQVSMTKNFYSGNHIIVAYGYQKVNYYNANNTLIQSNTYIYVSSGIHNEDGHYLLNSGGNMIAAEAIVID
ncbi:MAG: hypothetical protein K2N57_05860 [Clostridia bacterium]|nr:hypothetical protein [Clostridia bacterium]